jgi:ABC-2 type transport system permease protein
MNKILLIIQREYLSRVKKKSFILMTLLTPIIIAAFYGMMIYFTVKGTAGTAEKIAVVNENTTLTEKLVKTDTRTYVYVNEPLANLKKDIRKSGYDYILYIPNFSLDTPTGIQLIGAKQPSLNLNNKVEGDVKNLIRTQKLKESGLAQADVDRLNAAVNIDTKKIDEGGKEENSSAGATAIIGSAAGILMFLFIFIYGVQVMRGVIEEKTSRIIEVMISSVKPFQLMMGKIIGIALVGLTQFILWIVLSVSISTIAVQVFVGKDKVENINAKAASNAPLTKEEKTALQVKKAADGGPVAYVQKSLASLNITKIVTVFLIFFIGGYLFYSALYAAIGSAVDSETETQQFMMPVMMPLFVGYGLSLSVVNSDPYGTMAFWLSMIPFTSPIAMMVRLPYGVPDWQLALSIVLLIGGFIGTVWIASRIYRVGILMYGKKTNFKELIKWFSYKN